MNAALWIVSVIAILIILDVYNKKEEKRHKELLKDSKAFQNAIKDFTHAVESLEITEEQFNSQRRWMRGTLNGLERHEKALDEHLKNFDFLKQQKESFQTSLFKEDE